METYRFLVTKIVYYKPTSWYIYIHCNQAETSCFFLQYSNNSHYRSSLWCVFQQHIHGNLPSDDLVPVNKNMGGRKETVLMLFHHRANELLRLCRNKPATRQNSQVSQRQQSMALENPKTGSQTTGLQRMGMHCNVLECIHLVISVFCRHLIVNPVLW